MSFNTSATTELLFRSFLIITGLVTPSLTVLAYRGWAKHIQENLPRWRTALGLTSILLTFIGWLSFVILSLILLMGLPARFFTANWTAVNGLIAVLGTSLAFALKGPSRIQAVVAGFLMATVWSLSLFTQ